MKKSIPFLLFLLVIPGLLLGQEVFKISGKVTDANGEPLIGASIVISQLNTGAPSDLDGKYVIEIPKSLAKQQTVSLSASFVNYKKKTVNIVLSGSNLTQDFVLEEDVFQSEEVVVTGIASKTAKSVAEVSVARISAADLQGVSAYNGLSQLVAGKITGVQMTNSSGNIGGGWRFMVRGGGGLNGDGQPTIYVDGVRVENTEVGYSTGGQLNNTLSGLNANDIEKIEVLKGPAAAAMYGTNGANGVVLITTKTGKLGLGKQGMSVEYRFNYGSNEKQFNYNTTDYISADEANSVYRVGLLRENYISLAGGGPDLRYYASIEKRLEDGVLSTNSQDRTTARINLTSYPYDNLNLKLNAYFVSNKVNRPNNDNSIYGWLGNVLLRPTSYTWTARNMLEQGVDEAKEYKFIGSIAGTYSPIDNLEINATLGLENSSYNENRFYPIGYNALVATGEKSLYDRYNRQLNFEVNAAYNYSFDQFKFRSTVGMQFFDRYLQSNNATGQGFNSTLITTLGSASTATAWGESFLHTREGGLFTEHQINYLDQYFLTLGLRTDYATAIGANAPSITYPKASFAVRIDKFDFLPSEIGLLKLRVAYGEGGILPGNTDGVPLLWNAATGGYGAGAGLSTIGNDKIEPERVKELELGFDTEVFKSVSLEFTYYQTWAEKSIVNRPLAGSTGKTVSSQPFNLGKVTGSGFESMIQYTPIRGADYNLDFTLIWNYQTNKIDDLGGSSEIFTDPNSMAVGKAKYQFYTFVVEGVNYSSSTKKYSSAKLSAARVDLGSPIPDHTGSFAVNFRFLKNFNLYALGEWGLNNKMFNETQMFANRFGNNAVYNRYRALLGLSEAYPGVAPKDVTPLTPGTAEYNAAAEEFARMDGLVSANYIQDASYFIFREASLSYDFTELLKSFEVNTYVKSLTVGIAARNILTISKYDGADVGINYAGARTTVSRGQDFLTLPTPRTINFWARIGF